MRVHLYPIDDNRPHLAPREIVTRVATSFPIVHIDWVRGDEIVEEKLQQLIDSSAPDVILTSHRALFGNTVVIRLFFPEFPTLFVEFVVQPDSRIVLKGNDAQHDGIIRHAAKKISIALNYHNEIIE